MAHRPIADVALLPRGIPYACSCGLKPHGNAEVWLVCPDGLAIQPVCRAHGEAVVAEYSEKLGEVWRLEPLYHDEPHRCTKAREVARG